MFIFSLKLDIKQAIGGIFAYDACPEALMIAGIHATNLLGTIQNFVFP
jgi:hypothetical protein